MRVLRFFTRALLVFTLALSTSQALALVVPEPCGLTEARRRRRRSVQPDMRTMRMLRAAR